jgi:hypothetical protein
LFSKKLIEISSPKNAVGEIFVGKIINIFVSGKKYLT